MSHIPDGTVQDIVCDQIDGRLVVARHFLDRITKSVPKEGSFEHFVLEANVDSFLFFSSSVIDMIKVEINNRFGLFDRENVFYIHGIRKKLDSSGVQGQVKDAIVKYFSVPSSATVANPECIATDQGYFDATDSSLWQMQSLRNKAAHGKILNISDHKISLDFTIRDASVRKNPKYTVTVENPSEYFLQIFNNLASFVRQIRLLNPQKAQSSHHTERLDFRLE